MNRPPRRFATALPRLPAGLIPARELTRRLNVLRRELADLAYRLDTRGRRDAAAVTMIISARLAEVCAAPASDRRGGVRADWSRSLGN